MLLMSIHRHCLPGRVDASNSCPTTILRSLTTRKAVHSQIPCQLWRLLNYHLWVRTLSHHHCCRTPFTTHLSFHVRRLSSRSCRHLIEIFSMDTKVSLPLPSLLMDGGLNFLQQHAVHPERDSLQFPWRVSFNLNRTCLHTRKL